tara:strand:+ start:94 stop:492 length:399 start_codon:yes stop_codon:yes gene_type:complete
MKKFILILVASLFSLVACSENSNDVESAIKWLEIVDSGNYEQSWSQAAPFFQEQISAPKWTEALSQIRAPLSSVISRKVSSADPHESLPGVPDGNYVVITLVTSFAKKETAIETITVSKTNNDWRTIGYFIK